MKKFILTALLTLSFSAITHASVRCDLAGTPAYSVIMDFENGKALLKGNRHTLAELDMLDGEHADLTVRFSGIDVNGRTVKVVYDASEDANDGHQYGSARLTYKGMKVKRELKNCH